MNDSSPLRVVHVCCTDAFAGVERHVSVLASAQAAAGHDVTVVGGHQEQVRTAVGPDVRVLPGHRVDEAVRSLRRLEATPDVLNVHMTGAEVAVSLAWWLRAVPMVSTRHFAARRGSRRATRGVVRLARRRVDAQVAVSQYVADRIDGVSTVVPSGVAPEPDGVSAAQRDRVVLVAQRLEREKHTDVALRAFAESGLAAAGWRVLVAGDGALRGDLEAWAATSGLGGAVEFLGHRSDVHTLMERAALLLAPCPTEAFGLSVVEAMARSLPVVAAGSGAHLETVGSVPEAALFAPGDVHDAARRLEKLSSDEHGRDEYAVRLRSAQRARFSVATQVRRTDEIYRSLA